MEKVVTVSSVKLFYGVDTRLKEELKCSLILVRGLYNFQRWPLVGLVFGSKKVKIQIINFWSASVSLQHDKFISSVGQRREIKCPQPIGLWRTMKPHNWFSSTALDLFDSVFTCFIVNHYNDVIMGTMASQITSLTIAYSTYYSGVYQRKHQSSASLAFVWGNHRSQVTASNAENVSIWWRHHDHMNMKCSSHGLSMNSYKSPKFWILSLEWDFL